MNRNIENFICENKRRLKQMYSIYDPVSGIGSTIERFELKINMQKSIYLPIEMLCEPMVKNVLKYRSIENVVKRIKRDQVAEDTRNFLIELYELRINYDFEFWAYLCVKVQDKKTKKIIPFKLRKSQLLILRIIEQERQKNATVNVILLKARQFGGSTLIQMWFAWIQTIIERNWHSVIVADVESQTRRIRAMYSLFAKEYPKELGSITIVPFEGETKNKVIKERGCIMSIGSMQKPESLRSSDNALIHASEIGLWKKTREKSPEDLTQSLFATVPEVKNTAIILESTAKGVGNYFHRTWTENTSFVKIFVPWYSVELYTMDIKNKEEYTTLINGLNEYELFLWECGATLEGIKWYRNQLAKYGGDTWRMNAEYPTTPTEAFQSTGRRYYPPILIDRQRKTCLPPNFKGFILSEGDKSLQGIEFYDDNSGKLWIWSKPDKSILVSNRYIVSVDIGGTTENADWSTINVFDRYWLIEGGALERVATYVDHTDQDILAWHAAKIAKWYDNALLIVEVNSLDKEEMEGAEGVHYMTVLDEIADEYDNLYTRTDPTKIAAGVPASWGFHMNKATKPMVMSSKRAAIRDGAYIEWDLRAVDEADVMEIRPNGVISAVEGSHDDIEVPTATAIYVSNQMDAPKIIEKNKYIKNKSYVHEANF